MALSDSKHQIAYAVSAASGQRIAEIKLLLGTIVAIDLPRFSLPGLTWKADFHVSLLPL